MKFSKARSKSTASNRISLSFSVTKSRRTAPRVLHLVSIHVHFFFKFIPTAYYKLSWSAAIETTA